MAIEADITVVLASVEVSDEYAVELTVRDAMSGDTATVALTPAQTQDLMDELQTASGDAVSKYWEDRAQLPKPVPLGFDKDLPGVISCRDCVEGKHGACIGSAYTEVGGEIAEVACGCTTDGHRGRL